MANDNQIIAELVIKGVDEFKAQLSQTSKSTEQVKNSIKGLSTEAKKEFRELINEIDKAETEFEKLDASIKLTKSLIEFSEDAKEIELLTKELKKAEVEFAKLNNANKTASASQQSFRTQIRQSREELATLMAQGKITSSEIYKLAKGSGELKDAFGDVSQAISVLSSDTFNLDATIQGLQTITSVMQVGQGVSALFGVENEKLQRTLVKLNALMAITSGLQQIQNNLQAQSALRLRVSTIAQNAYNAVVGQSTGAMKLFKIALASTGVGLLIIGLTTLIANFDKVKTFLFNLFPPLKALGDNFGEIKKKVVDFVKNGILKVLNSFVELYNSSLLVRAGLSAIGATFKNLVGFFVANTKTLIDISTLWWKVLTNPKDAIKTIKSTFSGIVDRYKQFGKDAIDNYTDGIESAKKARLNKFTFDLFAGAEDKGKEDGEKYVKGVDKEVKNIGKNIEPEPIKINIQIDTAEDVEGLLKKEIERINNEIKDLFNIDFLLGKNPQENEQIKLLIQQLKDAENKLKDFEDKFNKLFEEGSAKRKGLARDEAQTILDINIDKEQQINKRQEQQNNEEIERMLELANKGKEIYGEFYNALGEFSSLFSNSVKQKEQEQLDNLKSKKEQGLLSERQYEKEVAKVKLEAAKKQHRLETIQAFAKVPQIVLNALTSVPFPANIALAAIYGAIATAQAVLVAKNKPKFKHGGSVRDVFKGSGYVKGKSHEQGGVNAELEGNEYVIKGNSVDKYGKAFLDRLNKGKINPYALKSIDNFKFNKVVGLDYKKADIATNESYLKEKITTLNSYNREQKDLIKKTNDILNRIDNKLVTKAKYV